MITKFMNGNKVLNSQANFMTHVKIFYKNLYNYKDTTENYDDLLTGVHRIDKADRVLLDQEITLTELETTLKDCKDSAPGRDGILYKVYRALWDQIGIFILDSLILH